MELEIIRSGPELYDQRNYERIAPTELPARIEPHAVQTVTKAQIGQVVEQFCDQLLAEAEKKSSAAAA